MLLTHYPTSYHPELRVQYVDSEGDRIDVNSELEWAEMFEQFPNDSVIKIHILEGNAGKYFKDGPSAEPISIYNADKTPVSPSCGFLKSTVPKCLEMFFPSGKILPYNVPSFLGGIVTVTKQTSQLEVDIDVDISKLRTTLFNKGLSHFDHKEYDIANHTFRALCVLDPQNPLNYYNVACAESLSGNIAEATLQLSKAIELGYQDFAHMAKDSDLDNIRNTKEFYELCRRTPIILTDQFTESGSQEPPFVVSPEVPLTQDLPEVPREPPFVASPVSEIPPVPEVPKVIPKPREEPVAPQIFPVISPVPEVPQVPEVLEVPEVPSNPFIFDAIWQKELDVLRDIGFMNDEIIIPILARNKGNVERTVMELLDM